MIETKIIIEDNQPKFVIMDYSLFDKFYDLIEQLEDEIDSRLDVSQLGPKIPFEVVKSITSGKNPITAWREYRSLTQIELAKKLKVSQAQIAEWENPKANPRKNTLSKIAKALKCPIESLIT